MLTLKFAFKNKKPFRKSGRVFLEEAVRMGLEPTTPGVTGPYSNQLNYRTGCSQLCVFLKRGCKDRYNFYFCKFFLKIFLKISYFPKTEKVTGKISGHLLVRLIAANYLTSMTL